MADVRRRHPRDRGGDWFVDTTCIGCDVARQVAPGLIAEDAEGLSYFVREPRTAPEVLQAWRALLACPSGSIGAPSASSPPADAYPHEVAPGVFLAGYHSRESFGAHSYFVPSLHGNFLVDSPRYVPPLVKAFHRMGGLRHILLTHRDDVADYSRYAQEFGARVWIAQEDADAAPEATDVFARPVNIAPDLEASPLPGHTRGSACFRWRQRFLFTGDSLAWSRTRDDLTAFRDATWFSWDELRRSLRRLAEGPPFEWVLPGHGSVGRDEPTAMRRRLVALVKRMGQANAASSW